MLSRGAAGAQSQIQRSIAFLDFLVYKTNMKRFRAADVTLPQRAGARPSEEVRERASTAPSFENARRTLHELLSPLTFVRVISVGQPRGAGSSAPHATTAFTGEGEEVRPTLATRGREGPGKRVFFSSFSRQNGLGFSLGGCATLVDSPLGSDHVSSVPQIGTIMVGSMVASSKARARCPFELRGWCNNARPLMELHRIVQFGTRGGESETRLLVRQAAAETAVEYSRTLAAAGEGSFAMLSGTQRRHCASAASVADELDCLARVVLYGSMECLKGTPRLGGRQPREFVETLVLVLRDSRIIEEYNRVSPPPPPPVPAPLPNYFHQSMLAYGGAGMQYDPVAQAHFRAPVASSAGCYRSPQRVGAVSPPRSPQYCPSSPPPEGSKTPPYAPQSPQYCPTSPVGNRTPQYAPQSPRYEPQSPQYAPQSPRYVPQSPPYCPSPLPAPPPGEAPRQPPSPPFIAASASPESGEETAVHSLLRSAISAGTCLNVRDSDL